MKNPIFDILQLMLLAILIYQMMVSLGNTPSIHHNSDTINEIHNR